MSYQVRAVPLATSCDHEFAWALQGYHHLTRDLMAATFGHEDLGTTARSLYQRATNPYATALLWVAVVPGSQQVLGALVLDMSAVDNTHLAAFDLVVTPAARRRGIGTALLAAACAQARDRGRTTLLTWGTQIDAPFDADDQVRALSGTGTVARHEAATQFALAHGFQLEQTEQHSVLELPVAPALLQRLEADSRDLASGYRLVHWFGSCPEQFLDAYAHLREAMSVDVPSAGLAVEREVWDGERIRVMEQRWEEGGWRALVVAAQEVASGELGGYSYVTCHVDKPAAIIQHDTLVLRAHRGHRLGMALKVALTRLIGAQWPQGQRIHTWNAAENQHMLAINAALGFRPASVSGGWQKRL